MRRVGFILVVFCLFQQLHAEESFSAYIAQDIITIGQPDTLYLSLSSVKEGAVFPAFQDMIVGKIEVLGVGKLDTNLTDAGIIIEQAVYFTSFDTGYFVIPPFQIQLKDTILYSRPILLRVEEAAFEMAQEIRDIADVADAPYTWQEILMIAFKILLIFLFILLIIILVRHFYLKYKNKDVEQGVVEPRVLFSEQFKERLEELKTSKIWLQGKEKEFQSELSQLLREYLEHRFEIIAMERTTKEITEQLAFREVDKDDFNRISQMLRFADMVKFAKANGAIDEHEKALVSLEALTNHFGFKDGE